MRKQVTWRLLIALAVLIASAAAVRAALREFRKPERDIPTARVARGDVEVKVFATGDLRTGRTAMLVAPAVGGGTLQIVHLKKTGTPVRAGDVVIEFDPSEQDYALEQSRSGVLQADQEITKAKADARVQKAQDQVALLKAKFDVRRAELEVSKNELVSAIDARKNRLALEEARRALAQLEQDIKSHAASNQATLAVNEEKRNKARLAMQQAQANIESMRVRSPIDGLVEVKGNTDATGGFFFGGMTVPEYREGDVVQPGRFVAQVLDPSQMEIQAKVNEIDRANLSPDQPVEVRVDALPEETFSGRVKMLAGVASRGFFWGGSSTSQFDLTVQLAKPEPQLRQGLTARLVITGAPLKDVLYLPPQAVFEKNGKPVVYVKNGNAFNLREVKVKLRTESRIVVEGLGQGTDVALRNPEEEAHHSARPVEPLGPALGGGGR